MTTLTLEQARARVKANFPKETKAQSRSETLPLSWLYETKNSKVSHNDQYRIVRACDGAADKFKYDLFELQLPNTTAKHIIGSLLSFKEAADAAEAHRYGQPIQSPLA